MVPPTENSEPVSGAGSTLEVTELDQSSRLGGFQLRIVALCALVVALDGFDVQTITYVAPVLTKALNIERTMLGPLFSAGLPGTTLGVFVRGTPADRLGRKAAFIACHGRGGIGVRYLAPIEGEPPIAS